MSEKMWTCPCQCATCHSGAYIVVSPDGKSAYCKECGRRAVKVSEYEKLAGVIAHMEPSKRALIFMYTELNRSESKGWKH